MSLPDNASPPYYHWHAACAACSRLIFVQAGRVPGPLYVPTTPLPAKCPYCEHSQAYSQDQLLLHTGHGTVYTPEPSKPAASVAAVIAGMVLAVRLVRVDSAEMRRGSPRVRAAISDGIALAHALLAEMGPQRSGR